MDIKQPMSLLDTSGNVKTIKKRSSSFRLRRHRSSNAALEGRKNRSEREANVNEVLGKSFRLKEQCRKYNSLMGQLHDTKR